MKYPGKNDQQTIMKLDKNMADEFIKFIGHVFKPVADVGEINAKSKYISEAFNVYVDQIECDDFNFYSFPAGRYNTIFCFEVLEHIQNPLFFIREVISNLWGHGTLFLSMPGRPKFFWSKAHFYEMTPKHFEKWICEPLGLTIVRKKRVRIKGKLDFKGIRPALRTLLNPFFNYTYIYEIQK